MHTTQIVEVKQSSDGTLAVRVRCCNDPLTDSIMTIHFHGRTDEEIQQDIQKHHADVAQKHTWAGRAKNLLAQLTDIPVNHSGEK